MLVVHPDTSRLFYILKNALKTCTKVFSLGAFSFAGKLLGKIIGELQLLERLEEEVGVVLERSTPDIQDLYIVSLEFYRRNKPADGLLFCCYVNGGQAFVGKVRSYLRHYITETALCRVLTQLWTYVCNVLRTTLQRNKFYSFYT